MDPGQAFAPEGIPDRGTDLEHVFEQIAAQLTRRSLVVLISDLLGAPEDLERGLARLSYGGHDVILLQILDHAELEFEFSSPVQFVGLESEGRLNIDPAALRRSYLAALKEHQDRIQKTATRFRFDHVVMDTSLPVEAALSHYLARRDALLGKRR